MIVRSIAGLLNMCLNRKKKKNISIRKNIMAPRRPPMRSKINNHSTIAYSNVDMEEKDEIQLGASGKPKGYRERAVDCPSTTAALAVSYGTQEKSTYLRPVQTNLTNSSSPEQEESDEEKEDSLYAYRKESPISESIEETMNRLAKENMSRNVYSNNIFFANNTNKRSILQKYSSLSTISEEKTIGHSSISTSPDMLNKSELYTESYNPWVLIQSILNDFQNKSLLMQEILHVFEPSSKHGIFKRGVPIRLSSPLKEYKYSDDTSKSSPSTCESRSPSSFSSSSSSSCNLSQSIDRELLMPSAASSNVEYYSNASRYIDPMLMGNRIIARKMRLVKRLKNRIETKRGRSFNNENTYGGTSSSSSDGFRNYFISNSILLSPTQKYSKTKSKKTIRDCISKCKKRISLELVKGYDLETNSENNIITLNQSIQMKSTSKGKQNSEKANSNTSSESSNVITNNITNASSNMSAVQEEDGRTSSSLSESKSSASAGSNKSPSPRSVSSTSSRSSNITTTNSSSKQDIIKPNIIAKNVKSVYF
jgi:hypothetical protein